MPALDLTSTTSAVWTELSPSGTAPACSGAAAVYDPENEAVYLLGGETWHALADDPLCLDLSGATPTWQRLAVSGDALPDLAGAAATWAADHGGTLLFGGVGYHRMSSSAYFLRPTARCEVEVTALGPSGDDPGARCGGS
jgi:hypothetical protein